MDQKHNKILFVDDEPSMREMVGILLKRHGYEVETAHSGKQAIARIDEGITFDLVITDLVMDRGGGMEVLARAKEKLPHAEVIVVTAYGTAETAVEAMKKGAFDYLSKPFIVDEFVLTVRKALERLRLLRENATLRDRVRGKYRFSDIVGRSPSMREVIDLARRAAETSATVLVSGESGTGKELLSRALHSGSTRAAHPFVAVNCGALPEALMESELFGHIKGSFTGASENRLGLFKAADGGTIFLDEVGELPLPLQVKLLRVLQDRMVRPVGSSEEQEVDVRVVAATNQDLEQLVGQGRFRTDLFYRLNVIRLHIPPLRERREDIPALVELLRERFSLEWGRPVPELSKDALEALVNHDFPGNVRELANLIERAATLCRGPKIEVSDFPIAPGKPGGLALRPLPDAGMDLEKTLEETERAYIEQALAKAGGNRTKAAELLGVTYRSFRYRLKKLGYDAEEDIES
jgi:two-component system response regulator PilR (NtrC family)